MWPCRSISWQETLISVAHAKQEVTAPGLAARPVHLEAVSKSAESAIHATLGTTRSASEVSKESCMCRAGSLARTVHSDNLTDLMRLMCQECGTGLKCAEGVAAPMQCACYYVHVLDPQACSAAACIYFVYSCRNILEYISGSQGHCAEGRTGLACAACMVATSARSASSASVTHL